VKVDWRGKVVVVTGSGTGVGATCARLLATHDARVVAACSRRVQASA
jgi:NAD(P)-dependent dehydrogenase (short-subunit alcohol dehydrogenase family)